MPFANQPTLSVVLDGVGVTLSHEGTEGNFKGISISDELGPAKTGALTTRTDANTGTLTMDTGHGITTGDRLDVYWSIDGVNYCQRGITAGTVSGNSVPIDSGVGDDLPVVDTEITAMVPAMWTGSVAEANIEGWTASISGLDAECGAQVCVGSGSFTEAAAFLLQGTSWTGPSAGWSDGIPGWTSPLDAATTITKIYYSHGDAVNTCTFTMTALTN